MARIEILDDRREQPVVAPEPDPSEDPCRELGSVRGQLSRLAADYTNYRRRSEREATDHLNHGKAAVLADIVEVADDLERALGAGETDPGALREGLAGIDRRLRKALDKHSVHPIVALGQPFDPGLHEAIAAVPANGVPPDCIAEEHQRGYLFNGKLLRPARVIVAKAMPDSPSHSQGTEEVSFSADSDQRPL